MVDVAVRIGCQSDPVRKGASVGAARRGYPMWTVASALQGYEK